MTPAGRIQKVLANAGIASRREIERWIVEGRVAVDGRIARIGEPLSGKERVVIDGRPVKFSSPTTHSHVVYHKPAGELTTREDPEGRPTVFEQIRPPKHGRWVAVGRLDMGTSGLLLLTTDGELAHRLMHPRHQISREYAVRILGEPSAMQWERLTNGIELEDGLARFNSVEPRGGDGVNSWYHVTLSEGRNREVRRMFEALGLTVSRLLRVRYGPIELGRLRRGETRELSPTELTSLYAAVGLEWPRPASSGSKPRPARDSRPRRRR